MCPRVLVPVTRESQGTISDCERLLSCAGSEAGAARNRPQIKQWEWVGHGTIVHSAHCAGVTHLTIMPANISRGYNWSNQIIGEYSRNSLSLCSAAIMAIIKMLLWKRFLWINVTLYVNIPSECIQCTPLLLHYRVHFMWKSPIYSSIVFVM